MELIKIKERPIIFNTEMVRAILDGRKTQTRRVVKELIDADQFTHVDDVNDNGEVEIWWDVIRGGPTDVDQDYAYLKCHYGSIGDRLYVRETFGVHQELVYYRAKDIYPSKIKWKPSIHMPKKYARIWLEVVSVRVERVQDISCADCFKEGIYTGVNLHNLDCDSDSPIPIFKDLWNSINEKRGYGWNVNPWVWVIEFKVAEK